MQLTADTPFKVSRLVDFDDNPNLAHHYLAPTNPMARQPLLSYAESSPPDLTSDEDTDDDDDADTQPYDEDDGPSYVPLAPRRPSMPANVSVAVYCPDLVSGGLYDGSPYSAWIGASINAKAAVHHFILTVLRAALDRRVSFRGVLSVLDLSDNEDYALPEEMKKMVLDFVYSKSITDENLGVPQRQHLSNIRHNTEFPCEEAIYASHLPYAARSAAAFGCAFTCIAPPLPDKPVMAVARMMAKEYPQYCEHEGANLVLAWEVLSQQDPMDVDDECLWPIAPALISTKDERVVYYKAMALRALNLQARRRGSTADRDDLVRASSPEIDQLQYLGTTWPQRPQTRVEKEQRVARDRCRWGWIKKAWPSLGIEEPIWWPGGDLLVVKKAHEYENRSPLFDFALGSAESDTLLYDLYKVGVNSYFSTLRVNFLYGGDERVHHAKPDNVTARKHCRWYKEDGPRFKVADEVIKEVIAVANGSTTAEQLLRRETRTKQSTLALHTNRQILSTVVELEHNSGDEVVRVYAANHKTLVEKMSEAVRYVRDRMDRFDEAHAKDTCSLIPVNAPSAASRQFETAYFCKTTRKLVQGVLDWALPHVERESLDDDGLPYIVHSRCRLSTRSWALPSGVFTTSLRLIFES